jgi:hypothetical protein
MAASSPDESKAEWETEKVKLVSERDAALAQSNVRRNAVL